MPDLRALLTGSAARFIPSDERVLMVRRPSAWWILMHRWRVIVLPALLMVGIDMMQRRGVIGTIPTFMPLSAWAVVWVLLVLEYQLVAWLSRMYVLTHRRIMVVAGIIAREAGDVPLASVQHAVMSQSWWERVLGLGTIGVTTAGGDGPVLRWLSVAGPERVLGSLRVAIDGARLGGASPPIAAAPCERGSTIVHELGLTREDEGMAWCPVIGIAGGIGSGKSAVGKAFEELGCVVIDSDREARAVLDRPEVRQTLVEWWGPGVVTADGRTDRKAIADIVFADAAQRTRLEELVHPLVRSQRATMKERAMAAGARGVVVDAPLLFEAGVDAECDVTVFVDAPRELRVQRVQSTRGWSEAELTRREASQMPLEEKRRRSALVIVNDGTTRDLRNRVAEAFRAILAMGPG